MIRIESLSITNFGSFREKQTIRMEGRGLCFVVGQNLDEPKMESNGSGKSTLFDALAWGLFGHSPKGDVAKSVIHDGTKTAEVSIILFEEKDHECAQFRIHRTRGASSGLYIHRKLGDGEYEDLSKLDSSATQEVINSVLGMDREVFHAAVYRTQLDSYDFATATDAKRKDLLTKLIPELAEVDVYRAVVDKRAKNVSLRIQSTQQEIDNLNAVLQVLNKRDFKAEETAWRSQQDKLIASLTDNVNFHANKAAEFEALKVPAEEAAKEIAKQSPPSPVDIQPLEEAIKSLISQATSLRTQYEMHTYQWDKCVKDIDVIRTHTLCTHCGQSIPPSHLQQRLQTLEAEADTIQEKKTSTMSALAKSEWDLASKRAEREKLTAIYQRDLKAYYESTKSYQDIVDKYDAHVHASHVNAHITYSTKLSAESAALWPGLAECENHAAECATTTDKIGALSILLNQYLQIQGICDFWKEAFSNKGLKSYILDSKIAAMAEAANRWIDTLTGGSTWIELDTQTKNQSGKFTEKIDIRVFRRNTDGSVTQRNFKSLSGGEKKRVSLGLDQGIATLVADRAQKPWDLYIIDESFRQHLDQGGREAVFELLECMQDTHGTIFVVDHDPQMAAQFESSITVRLKDRVSVLMENE